MFFSKTLPFSFWGNVAYLQSGRQRFPDGLIFARAGSNAKIFLAKNPRNQEKIFFVVN